MFDTKHQQIWPDLSRYVLSIGSHGKRWELKHLCKAYYRFNEWAGSGEPGFIDRSGIQDPIMMVTGSGTGITSTSYPSVLPYDASILPKKIADNSIVTPSSLELVPGSDTRVIRPFVAKCFDFANRDRRFLLGNDLKDIDTTFQEKEYTFVARICVASPAGDPEVIFSISEFNVSLLSLQTTTVSATQYTLGAKVFDTATYTESTSANLDYDKWYTVFISVKGPTASLAGSIKLGVWEIYDGSRTAAPTVSAIAAGKTLVSLSSPKVFIGYGDSNASPPASFPVGASNEWGHHSKISELAILAEWTSQELNQAIASGWSDETPATHERLFTNWKSGIDSVKARKAQRLMDDARATYPSIVRTGDGQRLGNEKSAPYNDDSTLIFTSSSDLGPIRFPEMLQEQLFSESGGNLIRSSRKGLTKTSADDLGAAPWITASGSVRPGVMSREAFIFERNDGVYGQNLFEADRLGGLITPFVDSARDTAVEIIHLPATPLSTTLGFDQPLGSRIAIVIELNPSVDLTMGHVTTALRLTGSTAGVNAGLDSRTCVATTFDTGKTINSIAYFNFKAGEWNRHGHIADDTLQTDPNYFLASSSLAFGATTGFVINPDADDPTLPLMARGRPVDTFGFPFDNKWEPLPGQKLNLAKYISSPFLLEKIVITHNMDFYESGDEGLGYIIKEPDGNSAHFLAHSSSNDFNNIPDYARVDVTHPSPDGQWANKPHSYQDMFYAGSARPDKLTYGRFPLMGGMAGQKKDNDATPGLRNGLLMPSDDNTYKIVRNDVTEMQIAADTSLYTNAVTEEIELTADQTPGGAAFWRADTFFLLRDTVGHVDRTKQITPPPAFLTAAARGRWFPQPIYDNAQNEINWPYTVPETYTISSVSTGSIRELITYAQIAHCGYVRTDVDSQALKSGSTWQEVHPLRANALQYPRQNREGGPYTKTDGDRFVPAASNFTAWDNAPGAWRSNDSRGYPHPGEDRGNMGDRFNIWRNLIGFIRDATSLSATGWPPVYIPTRGDEITWPTPHPSDADPDRGWFTAYNGVLPWESRFVNAIYPKAAMYHPLGLDDCTIGLPTGPEDFPGAPPSPPGTAPGEFIIDASATGGDYPVSTNPDCIWSRPFEGQWHSGSREAGGGSFISNPVMFVSESAVLAKANIVEGHGAYDFALYGGFNTPGKTTNKTLLDAGLRRDLTIQINSGSRFVRLHTADPQSGMLGWCDIPPYIYDIGAGAVTVKWEKFQPTSAYLVATASREYSGAGDLLPLSSTLNKLNSGSFTIVSDIKNSTKGGAVSGLSFRSLFPQDGHELTTGYGYIPPPYWQYAQTNPTPPPWPPPGQANNAAWYLAFYGNAALDATLPVIPPNILTSFRNFSYPREGGFLHTIEELSPINPTMRSVGLSSGRSYIRGVVGTIETTQRGWFCPPARDIMSSSAFDVASGKYGWTGPVGAAHFTQEKAYTTAFQPTQGDGTNECFLGQLLPYALGYDTRYWITCFPGLGEKEDWIVAGEYGAQNAPVFSANHPPFCLGIMRQMSSSYSKEYVYNSPYLLFPSDDLVFGFQPAIGGGNEGAPRPINTPSGPFGVADSGGYQGVKANNYRDGTCNVHLPIADLSGPDGDFGNPFPRVTGGLLYDLGPPPRSDLSALCGLDGYGSAGIMKPSDRSVGDPGTIPTPLQRNGTYRNHTSKYKAGVNRNSLSEQIRQTILKAGDAKLVLYGTLLRDQKPLSSELNQPLVTNAVHEAMHFDNPVLDQFQVQQETEYRSSYLTQYITGSLLSGDRWRGVVGTSWDSTLSYNAAFNRFVTLVDEGEVYWDSLLPDPFEMWDADGIVPTVDYHGQPGGGALAGDGTYILMLGSHWDTGWMPYTLNATWTRNFPFESRYSDASRSLVDPADPSTKTVSVGAAWAFPSNGIYPDRWPLNADDGRAGVVMGMASPTTQSPQGSLGQYGKAAPYGTGQVAATFFVKQSRNTLSIGNAAYLYGFSRTQGLYRSPLAVNDPTNEPFTLAGTDAQFGGMYYIWDGRSYVDGKHGETAGDGTYHPEVQNQLGRWDHPEGVKYGLKNYVWQATAGVYRSDRYGQFRDMLEQRRYTNVFHRGDNDTDRGEKEAAVSCIFVDNDGNPVDDPTTTQCLNISTFMTSSIPYFEGHSTRVIPPSQFISININDASILSLRQTPSTSTR